MKNIWVLCLSFLVLAMAALPAFLYSIEQFCPSNGHTSAIFRYIGGSTDPGSGGILERTAGTASLPKSSRAALMLPAIICMFGAYRLPKLMRKISAGAKNKSAGISGCRFADDASEPLVSQNELSKILALNFLKNVLERDLSKKYFKEDHGKDQAKNIFSNIAARSQNIFETKERARNFSKTVSEVLDIYAQNNFSADISKKAPASISAKVSAK